MLHQCIAITAHHIEPIGTGEMIALTIVALGLFLNPFLPFLLTYVRYRRIRDR